jgi:hypothetical protein
MSMRVVRWAVASAVVLVLGAVSQGQGPRGFVGIQLDPTPLPELLIKHLGLKPNQGIRILNVSVGGPADKVGLDRDDIIILFQGKEVGDADAFVEAVRGLPIRSRITLEVIHLGQHKTVEFELAPMEGKPEWKYPIEAQFEVSWGPGRVFRLGPGGQSWIEIPFENVPDVQSSIKQIFTERYLYHHVTDGEDYTITVEGDPKDESTQIVVQSGPTEYKATIGTIDSLPEKYRAAARESVENATKNAAQRVRLRGKLSLPEPPDWRVFNDMPFPKLDPNEWAAGRDRMIEELQSQIDKLQQRLEQMENHMVAPDKSDKKNPAAAEPAEPSGGSDGMPKSPEKPRVPDNNPV